MVNFEILQKSNWPFEILKSQYPLKFSKSRKYRKSHFWALFWSRILAHCTSLLFQITTFYTENMKTAMGHILPNTSCSFRNIGNIAIRLLSVNLEPNSGSLHIFAVSNYDFLFWKYENRDGSHFAPDPLQFSKYWKSNVQLGYKICSQGTADKYS